MAQTHLGVSVLSAESLIPCSLVMVGVVRTNRMSIEIFGKLEKSSDLNFCCKIQIGNDNYVGFVVSKYFEYDIQKNKQIIYNARIKNISRLNIFLNRPTIIFSDIDNDLFKIYSSGIRGMLGFGMALQVKNHTLKLPRKFSFAFQEIGYEIEMARTNFRSSIRNEENLSIGIGLSYYIWLQQQRWINMD